MWNGVVGVGEGGQDGGGSSEDECRNLSSKAVVVNDDPSIWSWDGVSVESDGSGTQGSKLLGDGAREGEKSRIEGEGTSIDDVRLGCSGDSDCVGCSSSAWSGSTSFSQDVPNSHCSSDGEGACCLKVQDSAESGSGSCVNSDGCSSLDGESRSSESCSTSHSENSREVSLNVVVEIDSSACVHQSTVDAQKETRAGGGSLQISVEGGSCIEINDEISRISCSRIVVEERESSACWNDSALEIDGDVGRRDVLISELVEIVLENGKGRVDGDTSIDDVH